MVTDSLHKMVTNPDKNIFRDILSARAYKKPGLGPSYIAPTRN